MSEYPDAEALAADLRRAVAGPVRFTTADRAMWSADASNYRRVPIGVVVPRDVADAEAALSMCRAHDVPVLPVGARTSIAGQAVNTAVVLDFTRHVNRILEIDPQARTARAEPGVICDALRDARAAALTFGPDPSAHNRCTLGGMIGNNACGSHSVAWGKTVDNVHALDLLTYRGERVSLRNNGSGPIPDALQALGARVAEDVRAGFPDLTRRVSGYNLDQLLPGQVDLAKAMVGTEGTCGIMTAATVRLVESPPAQALAVLGFPDAYTAADHVSGPGARPAHDRRDGRRARRRAAGTSNVRRPRRPLPDGGGWLYVETGGATAAEARSAADAVVRGMRAYTRSVIVVDDPAAMKGPLADPRRRRGDPHPAARRRRGLAGLGGRRGAARAVWRLPARVRRAVGPARAARCLLRPLRRRLPARAHRLRPRHAPGHRELPGVP